MKTTLVICTFLIFTMHSNAQLVVNDPLANSSLLTSITQGAEQVRNGLEQLELLKKAKDAVDKVSGVVRDVKEIEEIYNIQKAILKNSTDYLRQLQKTNLFENKEMVNITTNYNTVIDNSVKSIEALNKVLSSGLFKMTDAERLEYIRALKGEMQVKLADTEVLFSKYKQVAQGRALSQMFKKQDNK